MKVTLSELVGPNNPSAERALHLVMDGVSPTKPVGLDVWIPLSSFENRRLEYDLPLENYSCVCCQCDDCKLVVDTIKAEVFAARNPDQLDRVDTTLLKRMIELGIVAGKIVGQDGSISDKIQEPSLDLSLTEPSRFVRD